MRSALKGRSQEFSDLRCRDPGFGTRSRIRDQVQDSGPDPDSGLDPRQDPGLDPRQDPGLDPRQGLGQGLRAGLGRVRCGMAWTGQMWHGLDG